MSDFQVSIKNPLGTSDETVRDVDSKALAIQKAVREFQVSATDIIRVREVFTERSLEDDRTLKQLAQEALDVQNASNLFGVVNSFLKAMRRLRQLNEDARNHSITVLWMDKLLDMTGRHNSFADAYTQVSELTKSAD